MWSHITTKKRFIALPLLAILLVNVAFAGTAVADPRIWVGSADLERDATLVGESVGVEVQLHNNGDSGAITVEVYANGTEIESERVHVEADSDKKEVIDVAFDEPGQYEITADSKSAGTLTVSRLRIASITRRDDGRTALVRASEIESGEPMTASLPNADDQSFALERVTMTGSGSSFNRSVATYSPADGASFSVPTTERSSVIGAVDMDSISGVDTTSLRVAIDRDTIREHGLQTDGVKIYRQTNGSYTPLDTEQAATTEDSIVYEATTDGGSQFVVGSLSAAFDVRSTKLDTGDATEGQQINLTTTVANDGTVAGDYVAEMRVDGATVDEQTVTIQPGESTTITLQHTVTKKGEYEVSLGEESVGSVVLTSDSVSDSDRSSDSETESTEVESTDEGGPDAGLSLPSLDDIGTLELGIGASIALVGGGLLLIFRR